MPEKVTKSVKVDPDLWKEAKHYAIDEETTLSSLVEDGLRSRIGNEGSEICSRNKAKG